MTWLWILMGTLAGLAGLRYRARLRSGRSGRDPQIDDAALRRILEEGRLDVEDDDPLDMREVERAEEEFWNESWDEPEEYRP